MILSLQQIVDLIVLSIRSLRKIRLEEKFDNFEVIHSNSIIENNENKKSFARNKEKLPIVKENSVETLATIVA